MYYYRMPFALDLIFQRAFAVSFVTVSFLYVVLWLTGKSGTIGLLVGSFVMVATLVLPLIFIATPSTSLALPWTACAALWSVFAHELPAGAAAQSAARPLRQAFAELTGSTYRGGGEIDFLIGTARPWTLAAGQIVPIAIATYVMWAGGVGAVGLGVLPHDHQRDDGRRREPRAHTRPRALAACALDSR
jgi:hypothetical protein